MNGTDRRGGVVPISLNIKNWITAMRKPSRIRTLLHLLISCGYCGGVGDFLNSFDYSELFIIALYFMYTAEKATRQPGVRTLAHPFMRAPIHPSSDIYFGLTAGLLYVLLPMLFSCFSSHAISFFWFLPSFFSRCPRRSST